MNDDQIGGDCEKKLYVLQDANYNVLGVVDESGAMPSGTSMGRMASERCMTWWHWRTCGATLITIGQ